MKRSKKHRALIVTVLTGAATAGALAGCSSASTGSPAAAATPPVQASAGDIEVTGAYIPQPASPQVAVAYLTLHDTGPAGDVLISAATDPVSQTSVMREVATGGNAGAMLNVSGDLTVPAYGSLALSPGGYHLMLTDPAARLMAGDHVTLTLMFKRAGAVRVRVPVTSLLSDAQTGAAPTSSMASMQGI
jgi:hypothetical protein